MIGRRDDDNVDIGSRTDLTVIVVDRAFVHTGGFPRPLLALVPDVVDGDRLDVGALLVALHHAPDVRVHPPAAADETDIDAVVRADDAAFGRHHRLCCRLLAGRCHRPRRGDGANLPDELAAGRCLLL
jgi:hypothetical protein